MRSSQAGWRQPLEGWRRTIDRWMVKVDGDDIINISVFIDFQPVRGEAGLAASLREYLTDKAARSAPLLHLMADNLQTIRAPLGVMGRFRSKRGLLDLKTSGLVPLVSAVRVLALKHRITATGTGERLAALAQGGWLNAPEAEALMAGHEMMLRMLLRQQIADSSIGRPVGNDIDLKRLSEEERAGLKDVFKAINALGWLLRNALSTV
ncbi:MAG: hypothetical protein K2Q10_11270 [Rhodospirillales bacterium]|nr:hypothetical protein [Rhodospirillales bacterium]